MDYLVVCTFDLENATYEDYQTAYADLKEIGLTKVIVGTSGSSRVMPTTTTAGEFTGYNSGKVRDDIRESVKRAFTARGFTSEIFVVVGDDWAWGATTT